MNIFDFILLVPPTYFCYLGIRKGFVKRILAILGLIFGVVVSYAYHNQFADFISDYWERSSVKYLAYVVSFVIVIILIKIIAAANIKKVIYQTKYRDFDLVQNLANTFNIELILFHENL